MEASQITQLGELFPTISILVIERALEITDRDFDACLDLLFDDHRLSEIRNQVDPLFENKDQIQISLPLPNTGP